MRPLGWCAVFIALFTACAPPVDPTVPDDSTPPCHTNDDCEIHSVTSVSSEALCGSRALTGGSSGMRSDFGAKDAAACGPMPNMSVTVPEPTLACFQGHCVPIGSR